ncbi:MAG: S8 family serine peptidase [Pseudomonadota bacterium]
MRSALNGAATSAALLIAAGVALQGCSGTGPIRPTHPEAGAAAAPEQLILVTLEQAPNPPPPPAGGTRKDLGWSLGYRASSASRRLAAAVAADYGLTEVDAWPIAPLGLHCVVYRLRPGEQREALLRVLAADRRVESAQPMQLFTSLSADPAPAQDYRALQRNLELLQVQAAHRWARGRGVRIAVIDTGLDLAHPELAGRVVEYADLAGSREPTAAFAAERHGTAVAGVIAGGGAGRMLGVAPAAELLALKACWPRMPGALEAVCNSFTLARALALALSLEADIVNLSLSGPPDPLLERLLRRMLEHGGVVVGALPQEAAPGPLFPTSVDGVIAVRNADIAGTGDGTALAAPGNDILTLAPQAGYEFQSGSSLAAAQVSGVIALLLEHRHGLPPTRLRDLLGAGSAGIDACAALAALLQREACTAQPALARH